ncbi:MAG: DUF4340 domain-containing protein [Planctomycetes bacterium]|nr:DUF4340 domain-containing protein [Planctomycetota bacterium]MCB9824735.1 DUF4340 domain-containing protein [Planctomycetota bacterium]MCB9899854.1 DUF4340 domain-containing protein [Planctomycetota bacterium]
MGRSPTRTLERRNLVLAGLAVVLGLWLLFRPEPARGVALDDLPALLPGLDTSAVRTIEIVRTDPGKPDAPETIRVARKELTTWVLPDRFSHPVLPNTAERLLDALAGARSRGTVTTRADTFERYRPSTGWKSVRLLDGAGGVLAALDLGRPDRSDLLVRMGEGDQARIVRVANLRPSVAPTVASAWIETQLWPGTLRSASMVELELDHAGTGGPHIVVVKRGVTAEGLPVPSPAVDPDQPEKLWTLVQPQLADADTSVVEDIGRAFTGLVADDVVAAAGTAEDATYGFDQPEVVATFYEQDGAQAKAHRLEVGKKADDKDAWYVRVDGRPFVYVVGAGHNLGRLRSDVVDIAPSLDASPLDGEIPPPDGD